jgi:hypothetical protein
MLGAPKVLFTLISFTLVALALSCGPGLNVQARVSFFGFPNRNNYQVSTRYLHGSLTVLGWNEPLRVFVSIDSGAEQAATVLGSVTQPSWRIALPERSTSPRNWNLGSRHFAQVRVTSVGGIPLAQSSGYFSMDTLRDANNDGYADLLVSSWLADVNSTDDGIVHYFESNGGVLSSSPTRSATDPAAETGGIGLGYRAYFVGDLNGDNYADAAVSAHLSSTTGAFQGGLYIAYGSASGLRLDNMTRINCTACSNNARFGIGVSAGGDLNNDGYDDLAVGTQAESKVFVYLGSASGIPTTPSQTLLYPGVDASPIFGSNLRAIPDITGDGFPELLVGSLNSDAPGPVNSGAAWMFKGTGTGVSATADATFYESPPYASNVFGRVHSVGDVNDDGLTDFGIASFTSTGKLYLFFQNGVSIPTSPSLTFSHPNGGSGYNFGHSAVSIGDITGDGISELAVGSPGELTDSNYSGQVFLYSRNSDGSGLSIFKALEYWGTDLVSSYGKRVCPTDFNSDGLMDLWVSAENSDLAATDAGAIGIYYQSRTGFSTSPQQVILDPRAEVGASFGFSGCSTN